VANVAVQSAASNPRKLVQRLVAHPEVRAIAQATARTDGV